MHVILTDLFLQSLHHLFSKCIGVDLSDGMLDKYRATAAELGLDKSHMLAVQGDLLAPTVGPTNPQLTEEELNGFDLVAICMALHHVEDIAWATKRLAERLRPGGVLLIIDWATLDFSNQTEQQAGVQTNWENHHHHHHHMHDIIDPKHPAAHTISHDSFSRDQIFSLFEQAGCGESQFVLADRLSPVPGARSGEMQLFWARATKL
jgi:SAM-dependent methyltransferase